MYLIRRRERERESEGGKRKKEFNKNKKINYNIIKYCLHILYQSYNLLNHNDHGDQFAFSEQ